LTVFEEVTYRRLAVDAIRNRFPDQQDAPIFVQGVEKCGSEIYIYYQVGREKLSDGNRVIVDTSTGATSVVLGE
jgi:hypothetical protein